MSLQRTVIAVTFSFFISLFSFSQKVHIRNSGSKASFRGLSVVTDRIAWVSGSNGVVGRTTDGGDEWTWIKVPRYETRDFRDIEAFDAVTAIIMAVDEPALILKTIDGGENWKAVYENKMPGMFLDAMEFWNEESGIVVGDPVKGKFFIARTFDGGRSWRDISADHLPSADSGEACYAASGTNIRALDRDEACFVSGGSRTRLFWKGAPVDIPFLHTGPSSGANSIAVRHSGNGKPYIVITGGDFNADSLRAGNSAVSQDGGKTWVRPSNPPYGYRSCVEFISGKRWIASGTTGVDISLDDGINWNNISSQGFHVCRRAKKGKAVFLAGSNGRIARLEW